MSRPYSVPKPNFADFNNSEMLPQVVRNFCHRPYNIMVEMIDRLAVRDSHYNQAHTLGRREIQDIRKTEVTGDQEAFFFLGIGIYSYITFPPQANIAHVHGVKTRVSKDAGRGTRYIFVCQKAQCYPAVTHTCSSVRRRAA